MIGREIGTIKYFDAEKGFGLIVRKSGAELPVQHAEIDWSGFRALNEGDRVEFSVTQSQDGPHATNVRLLR